MCQLVTNRYYQAEEKNVFAGFQIENSEESANANDSDCEAKCRCRQDFDGET